MSSLKFLFIPWVILWVVLVLFLFNHNRPSNHGLTILNIQIPSNNAELPEQLEIVSTNQPSTVLFPNQSKTEVIIYSNSIQDHKMNVKRYYLFDFSLNSNKLSYINYKSLESYFISSIGVNDQFDFAIFAPNQANYYKFSTIIR